MEKEYLNVCFAQLSLTLENNEHSEFLVENNSYYSQMESILTYLENNEFDVMVFPEISFCEKYASRLLALSKGRLIVFGSRYIEGENITVVYYDGKEHLIKKRFLCAVEPAVRTCERISVSKFLTTYLKEHTFVLNGKKLIVLNCAEYYNAAYMIARSNKYSKNLFGFVVPCANNNTKVFLEESRAIHNHNSEIYSFVVNAVGTYSGKNYAKGESYVFGKVSPFEKECATYSRLDHPGNICYLDDGAYLVSGSYLMQNYSPFYRSDNFFFTPKNFNVVSLGEGYEESFDNSRTNKWVYRRSYENN